MHPSFFAGLAVTALNSAFLFSFLIMLSVTVDRYVCSSQKTYGNAWILTRPIFRRSVLFAFMSQTCPLTFHQYTLLLLLHVRDEISKLCAVDDCFQQHVFFQFVEW